MKTQHRDSVSEKCPHDISRSKPEMKANAAPATISLDQAAVTAAKNAVAADVAPAAAALAAAANKGITAGVVSSLDARLGVNLDAAATSAIASQAAALQH